MSPEGKAIIGAVAGYLGVPPAVVRVALAAVETGSQSGIDYHRQIASPPGVYFTWQRRGCFYSLACSCKWFVYGHSEESVRSGSKPDRANMIIYRSSKCARPVNCLLKHNNIYSVSPTINEGKSRPNLNLYNLTSVTTMLRSVSTRLIIDRLTRGY